MKPNKKKSQSKKPRQKHPNLHNPDDDVLKYYPLVKNIANYFHGLNAGVELDDCVQEGFVGLLMAMRKYDPNKGVSLGAFANRYIFGRIYRSLLGTKNLIHNKKIILLDLSNKIIDKKSETEDFTAHLYDYIMSHYNETETKVLDLIFQNYKKSEIIKIVNVTNDFYDDLLTHFKANFVI
jgi:RNA polymerase sigma factor (sigma-70 family)